MISRLRTVPVVAAAVLAILIAAAMASPADAKGHPPKRQAVTMLHKQLGVPQRAAALGVRTAAEDEGNEAESLRARTEFEQSIIAAPAEVAPAAGLLAATRAAAALPSRGRGWDEVTDKPFLNDPVGRGQNYGVGWGLVTGRMTAFTARGRTVWAGSASGGVWRTGNQGRSWRTDNSGLPRLAIGALATSPVNGSVWVGTGEANNAAENQYGVGIYQQRAGSRTWHRVGGSELNGAGVHRIVWIGKYVYAATSHGLYRRARNAARSAHWRPVLQPTGPVVYPPTSDVTDVIAVPGSRDREILAVVGWAGYSQPPAVEHNGFYVGNGAAGSFTKVGSHRRHQPANRRPDHPVGFRRLAVRRGPRHQHRRPARPGRLRLPQRRPGRAVDADRRRGQARQLRLGARKLHQRLLPRRAGRLQPVHPGRPQEPATRLPAAGGGLRVHRRGHQLGDRRPVLELRHHLRGGQRRPVRLPADDPPRPARRDDLPRPVLGRQRRRRLAPPRQPAHSRPLDQPQRAAAHHCRTTPSAAGPVGPETAYWGGLQDNGESYARTNLNRVEQAFTGDGGDTIVDPTAGDRAVVEYVYLDMYRTTDGSQTSTEISPSCLTATEPASHL